MLEHCESKRSLNLRNIFRSQASTVDKNTSTLHRKAAAHLKISPPILQHSTNIYSIVSPTQTVFTDHLLELYQPTCSPPPIPQQKSPWSGSASLSSALTNNRKIDRPRHPLDFVPDLPEKNNYNRITVANGPNETLNKDRKQNYNRRHSCSSAVVYNQRQQKEELTVFPTKSQKSDLVQSKSLRNKVRERRRSSKVNSSYSTAATIASMESPRLEASISTPTRKVKTYNVHKKPTALDIEKQRKMQELENLIRRGSTLKLTLTPDRLLS